MTSRCLRSDRVVVLLVAAALGLDARADPAGRMRFTRYHPCGEGQGNGSHCAPRVLAEGEIAPETPSDLERFLGGEPVYSVAFRSQGGAMQAAMELGRIIRRRGLDTYVTGQLESPQEGDGVCASACVIAFAGGVKRSVQKGARIGVHQFRGAAHDAGEGAAQVAVVALAAYFEEMGVRREVVDVASVVPPHAIYWLKEDELAALGLDNTTLRSSRWRLDALDDGTVVAEVSQVVPGSLARVSLRVLRRDGRRLLTVTFRPHDERDASRRAQAAHMLSASEITLSVDGRAVGPPFPPRRWTQTREAFSTPLELSSAQAVALRTGKQLRVDVFMPNAARDYDPSLAFPLGDAGPLLTAALR